MWFIKNIHFEQKKNYKKNYISVENKTEILQQVLKMQKICLSPEWMKRISSSVFHVLKCKSFNLYATGFKWLQSTFAYDIIFARHLNFSTWFTKNFIIPGTKKDLIMD